jgi:hypothetical protein
LHRAGHYQGYGELDISSIVRFQHNEHTIATCSLNLLHSGFSRRAWPQLPADTYKGNGRVRHEGLIMHMGPLLSIQVHSYQSYEIKEYGNKDIDHDAFGGLDHFDIVVNRNVGLLGTKKPPVEVIRGKDLFQSGSWSSSSTSSSSGSPFIGFNEEAREICIQSFLSEEHAQHYRLIVDTAQSTLQSQQLTIDLFTANYL